MFSNPSESAGSFLSNPFGLPPHINQPNPSLMMSQNMTAMAGGLESQVDDHIKDRMLAQLSIDNKRLREDLTTNKGKVFQLEADLDYLRTTIEKNIPVFNQIEAQNKELLANQRNQTQSQKLVERLQNKVRILERKLSTQQSDNDKIIRKKDCENQQLKERLETVTSMNHSLQKKHNIAKKKAEQHDAVLGRCVQLEQTNEQLLSIVNGNSIADEEFVNQAQEFFSERISAKNPEYLASQQSPRTRTALLAQQRISSNDRQQIDLQTESRGVATYPHSSKRKTELRYNKSAKQLHESFGSDIELQKKQQHFEGNSRIFQENELRGEGIVRVEIDLADRENEQETMNTVVENSGIGIFTPLEKLDQQFQSKSAMNLSQVKDDGNHVSDEGDQIDVINEINDNVVINRSSFNLQRYFEDTGGLGSIRNSQTMGTHNEEYGSFNPELTTQSNLPQTRLSQPLKATPFKSQQNASNTKPESSVKTTESYIKAFPHSSNSPLLDTNKTVQTQKSVEHLRQQFTSKKSELSTHLTMGQPAYNVSKTPKLATTSKKYHLTEVNSPKIVGTGQYSTFGKSPTHLGTKTLTDMRNTKQSLLMKKSKLEERKSPTSKLKTYQSSTYNSRMLAQEAQLKSRKKQGYLNNSLPNKTE